VFTITLSPSAELHHKTLEKLGQLNILHMRVKSWWQGLDRIRLESSREHKPTSVLNNLWRTEERLFRDPDYATAYSSEIQKLEQAGYTTEVSQEMWESSRESRFIPHHMATEKQNCVQLFLYPSSKQL